MTDALVRPACLACDHPRCAPAALLCPPCRARLHQLLAELRKGHQDLVGTDLAPIRGAGGGTRSPGYGSRAPVREAVLALLVNGKNVQHTDPDTLRNAPLLAVAAHWADRAREDDLLPELAGPRTVPGELLRLSGIAGDLSGRWWVGDLLRSLAGTVHRVHLALGEVVPEIPLGRCPRIRPGAAGLHLHLAVELGPLLAATVDAVHCRGEVRGTRDQARCRRCQHRWIGEQAVHSLGTQLGDAMLDLPGLARYLDVTAGWLWKWASKDGWRREKVGRRTLYSLADARESARRAWERANPVLGCALPPGWGDEIGEVAA